MLVPEALGHLGFSADFQHRLRSLLQQPTRAHQVQTLLRGLREQPLRGLLLNDDLSRSDVALLLLASACGSRRSVRQCILAIGGRFGVFGALMGL